MNVWKYGNIENLNKIIFFKKGAVGTQIMINLAGQNPLPISKNTRWEARKVLVAPRWRFRSFFSLPHNVLRLTSVIVMQTAGLMLGLPPPQHVAH